MGRCPLRERLFLWSASASLRVPQGRGIKVDLQVSTKDNGLPSCAPFLAREVFDSDHSSAVERFRSSAMRRASPSLHSMNTLARSSLALTCHLKSHFPRKPSLPAFLSHFSTLFVRHNTLFTSVTTFPILISSRGEVVSASVVLGDPVLET